MTKSQLNLRQNSIKGASHQIMSGILQMILRMGASIILARILTPKDFGIMGMVLLVTGLFSQIGFNGFSSAIIAKQELNNTDLNTAFWLSMLTGLTLFLVLFFSAPFLEQTLHLSGTHSPLKIGALIIILGAIKNVSKALLSKNLRFGIISIITSIGVIIELSFAIWLTFQGYGYWSLIWAWLTAETFMTITSLVSARWCPGLKISKASYTFMIHYFSTLFNNTILSYLILNTDRIIVSWLLGPSIFGLYTFAIRLPSLIFDRLVSPASGIIFPMLAKRNYTENKPQIFKDYSKIARYLALMSFPLLTGIAVLAEPLVYLLWGKQWEPIIIPMQILCASYAFACVGRSVGTLFLVGHRPEILPKISLIKLPFSYIFVTISCLLWGLNGVAFGYFLRALLIGIDYFFAKKIFGASLSYFIKQIIPAGTASIFCGLATFICISYTNHLEITDLYGIILSTILGAATFFLILQLLFKSVLSEALSMIKATISPSIKSS